MAIGAAGTLLYLADDTRAYTGHMIVPRPLAAVCTVTALRTGAFL